MALPPTLPLLEPSAEHWSSVQQHWTDSVEMSAEARQLARMEILRPFLQEAIRELAIRHHLLADAASLHTRLCMTLSQRPALPSSSTMLRFHVASLALRMVKEESSVLVSRLDDPMAPWHAFRTRVNQLRRSFRAYFFAFLPKHSLAPMLFEKPRREPSKHWVTLWDNLTDGIPGGGIPSEWAQIRDNYQPTPIPGAFANRGGGLIAPARDWKEILAKPLLQAGALIESRRPGRRKLSLPKRLLPSSPVLFGLQLESDLQRLGGVPKSEPVLQEAISRLVALSKGIAPSELGLDPLDLVRLSGLISRKRHTASVIEGAILDRHGLDEESYFALHRGLQQANGRSEIGMALMNLAVHAFWRDLSVAQSIIAEARSYAPDSKLILKNTRIILTASEIRETENVEAE